MIVNAVTSRGMSGNLAHRANWTRGIFTKSENVFVTLSEQLDLG